MDGRSKGASASGRAKAGAILVRICENFDRSKGCGVCGVTRSSRYTMEVALSLLTAPLAETDCRRSARSAAKYPVGVNSVFCSFRVSSTADKTIAVCWPYQLVFLDNCGEKTNLLLVLQFRRSYFLEFLL
jgi:hypothetical protein